jgi:hypothetical protein
MEKLKPTLCFTMVPFNHRYSAHRNGLSLNHKVPASVTSTNVASLRVWWSVRNAVHGGEGTRLPALHSDGQVPALESDPYLSPLPAFGWVAHSAAGLL